MNFKPATYGATPIRVVLPLPKFKEVYFYDADEAVKFVKENWIQGKELSARVREMGVWVPIYAITPDGDIFVSPLFDSVIKQSTVYRGNILQEAK
jgi:hypothetical protein